MSCNWLPVTGDEVILFEEKKYLIIMRYILKEGKQCLIFMNIF